MNLVEDKFINMARCLNDRLPTKMVDIIVENVQKHSSKRVHPQWVQEALETIARESNTGTIWGLALDSQGLALLDLDRLEALGVKVALPGDVYTEELDKHSTCNLLFSFAQMEDAKDKNDTFLCFTGLENAQFDPEDLELPEGTSSLFDTVIYQQLSLSETIDKLNAPSSKPCVLFVGGVPLYNFSRQVGAMRQCDVECRLLTIHADHINYPVGGFTVLEHASGSIVDFFYLLKHVDVDCIHAYFTMNLYYQGMVAKLLSSCPVLFEFNDISSFFYTPFNFEYLYGKNSLAVETYAEKFICQNMDGLILQSEDVARYQKEAYGALKDYLILSPRPLESSFKDISSKGKDVPVRLVYAGVVAPSCEPRELYGDIQMRDVFGSILDQGFHLDVYTNDVMNFGPHYEEYRYLADVNSAFGMHARIHPDKIGEVLGQYHYGLMVYDFSVTSVGIRHLETIFPTKLMTYVEAGLPIIISQELAGAAAFIEENGLGLVLPEGQFYAIDKLIQKTNYRRVIKRFEEGRENIGIGKHISSLVDYYTAIMRGGN